MQQWYGIWRKHRCASDYRQAAGMVACWLCILASLLPGIAMARSADIRALIGQQDSLLVVDPEGNVIAAKNAHNKRIPASTLKVLTALVALHYLGDDYRFPTDFFLDGESNLSIKGFGDPLLISEVLAEIALTLAEKVDAIQDIIVDNSYFEFPIVIPGRASTLQPYDAPNGALCANFNTVFFKYHQGRYVSAEPQTPLIPFVLEKIQASGLKQERITFTQNQGDIPFYVGHLLEFFLQQAGVKVKGRIRIGQIQTAGNRLIYRYRSRFELTQVVARMLAFSNNFIANQLLIATGAKVYSAPGTLSKGVQAAQSYACQELSINPLSISEGSGISRKNRLSAAELLKVLEKFKPYYGLMESNGIFFFKTGTLRGINTRVGYVAKESGNLYPFVILINTPGQSAEPIMQQILEILP
jgi:D-alanyl-D-alanine carboxypeptidase/D-alanyl-D-alanine-endopeptidase (penicillin-binding protein 4)